MILEKRKYTMRMIILCLVAIGLGWCALAVESGDGRERLSGEKRQKFVQPENDPIFQALAALADDKLEEDIVAAMDAFFSSRFTEANTRVTAIMQKYPESSIGDTLYNFLLLMNGTALGFSGECAPAIEVLDTLITRLGDGDDAETLDALAGIIDLKIDILEASGDSAAALVEMDRLIDSFGDSPLSSVQWRVEKTMRRKALLMKERDNNGQ